METLKWGHRKPLHRTPILGVPKRCWIAHVASLRRRYVQVPDRKAAEGAVEQLARETIQPTVSESPRRWSIVSWPSEETEMSLFDTILSALLPMVVTFLLGFVAAWRHDFGSKDAPTLNRMVLLYAVPLALFAGTVTTSRAALGQDIPLVIALCVAIIGFYGVVFLLCRLVFRIELSNCALAARRASARAVPVGVPAVLVDLFGGLIAVPVAIASLVINLTVVPVTIVVLVS